MSSTDNAVMTIWEHLAALRRVLIISFISVAVTSVVGWIYSQQLLQFLVTPVTVLKIKLITTGVTEQLFTQLKVAVFAGILLALPVILYQLWTFFLPALKTSEKKYLRILVPLSVILFLTGVAFAYQVILPVGIKVLLTSVGIQGVTPLVSLSSYLSFLVGFLLPFGLIFELPLIILFLSKLGLISPKFLREKRKYAILIIFIAAAALTPGPDVVSQLLMAAPMYILYEASIIVSHFVYKERKNKEIEAEVIDSPVETPALPENNREEAKPVESALEENTYEATTPKGEPEAAADGEPDVVAEGDEDSVNELFKPTERDYFEREEHLEGVLDNIINRGEEPKK